MAASALGIHHAIPPDPGFVRRATGRDAPTQSLACHQPHEVEKGLVAVDEHALVILETDEVGNGIQQAALQQLLLPEGLLQLLALIDGADHGKQGDGVAVLVIQGNLC